MSGNLMKFSNNFKSKDSYNSGYASEHFFIPKSFEIVEYPLCDECGEIAMPFESEVYSHVEWRWTQGYKCCNGHWSSNLTLNKNYKKKTVIEARAYSKNFIKAINHPNNYNESTRGILIYSYGFTLILSLITCFIINTLGLQHENFLMAINSFIIPLTFYSLIWNYIYPGKATLSAACNFDLINEDNYSILSGKRYYSDSVKTRYGIFTPKTIKYYFPMDNYNDPEIYKELQELNKAIHEDDVIDYSNIIEGWGEFSFIPPLNGCEVDHGLFTIEDLKNNSIDLNSNNVVSNNNQNILEKTVNNSNVIIRITKYSTNDTFKLKLSEDFIKDIETFEKLIEGFNNKDLSKSEYNKLTVLVEDFENNSKLVKVILEEGASEEQLSDYKEIIKSYIKILEDIKIKPIIEGLHELKVSKNFIKDKYWSELNE